MIQKILSKLKKYLVSLIALTIVAVFSLFNFFNQKPASDNENNEYEELFARGLINSREMDGYFHEIVSCKYGGLSEPFVPQLLRVQKIYGVVRRKEDNKPIQGMVLKINKPEIKVLSDENGEFEFEIYNIVYDKFDIEVRDPASDNVLQLKTAEFKHEEKRYWGDKEKFFKDEATVEILL